MGKPSTNRRADRVTGRAAKTEGGKRANAAPTPASLVTVETRERGGRVGDFSHYPGPHTTPKAARVAPVVATAPWTLGYARTELDPETGARHLVRTDADEAREARRLAAREKQAERNTYAWQKRREANQVSDERRGGMRALIAKTVDATRRAMGRR